MKTPRGSAIPAGDAKSAGDRTQTCGCFAILFGKRGRRLSETRLPDDERWPERTSALEATPDGRITPQVPRP
jgi:hypothetical protein